MTSPVASLADRRSRRKLAAMPHDPARRGYSVLYRPGEINHCPGCGRSHWYVGRATAECAFCATAVPFEGARL